MNQTEAHPSPRYAVSIDWPPGTHPVTLWVAAVVAAAAVLPVIAINDRHGDTFPDLVGLILAGVAAVCAVTAVQRTRERRDALATVAAVTRADLTIDAGDTSTSSLHWMPADSSLTRLLRAWILLEQQGLYAGGGDPSKFVWYPILQRLDALGVTRPFAAIEAECEQAVREIPLTDALLEAEPVVPARQLPRSWQSLRRYGEMLVWTVLVCLIIAVIINARSTYVYVVSSLAAAALVLAMAEAHGWLGAVTGSRWLALPGCIVRDDEVFSADECLTAVFRQGSQYHVVITSRGQRTVLKFYNLRDPAFIDFWQRWAHPHPRPDLAATFRSA